MGIDRARNGRNPDRNASAGVGVSGTESIVIGIRLSSHPRKQPQGPYYITVSDRSWIKINVPSPDAPHHTHIYIISCLAVVALALTIHGDFLLRYC